MIALLKVGDMTLRFHEIAEANHRILNPFTEDQLMLLGEICEIDSGTRQLDLCCGKGEMLSRWAAEWGLIGVGVDISPVFLEAARQRARQLEVLPKLTFVEGDAADYPEDHHQFDIVSCIGATWIGGGLVGTLALMRKALKNERSLIVVGEPYWIDEPPQTAYDAITSGDRDVHTSLGGTLERFEAAGLELIEMVLADHHGWDRYVASQWKTVNDWLYRNPNDADAGALREWSNQWRKVYMQYERRYFGWGMFVLRPY
jgi:SAM-dependent methyltransferase